MPGATYTQSVFVVRPLAGGLGTVLDRSYAGDADPATYCKLEASTAGWGCGIYAGALVDDPFPVSQRASLVARLLCEWDTGDTYDAAKVSVSTDNGFNYTELDTSMAPTTWGPKGTGPVWVEFDLMPLAAAAPLSAIHIKVEFFNGDVASPPIWIAGG